MGGGTQIAEEKNVCVKKERSPECERFKPPRLLVHPSREKKATKASSGHDAGWKSHLLSGTSHEGIDILHTPPRRSCWSLWDLLLHTILE